MGMVLSYPIDEAPAADPDDLPAPVAPFVELEARSVETWFINALAVFAGGRDAGIGTKLLSAAETQAVAAGYPGGRHQVVNFDSFGNRLLDLFRVGRHLGLGAAVDDAHLFSTQPD